MSTIAMPRWSRPRSWLSKHGQGHSPRLVAGSNEGTAVNLSCAQNPLAAGRKLKASRPRPHRDQGNQNVSRRNQELGLSKPPIHCAKQVESHLS